MPAMITDQTLIDTLWDKGYRPYEIYTYNPVSVMYYGKTMPPGTVSGWTIKFVFSTREALKDYPCFDAVVCVDTVSNCEEIWYSKGGQNNG